MSKKKHKEEKEPNHERWLLTYADLITLLMIFFVVLYSMSSTSAAKYSALAASLGISMGGGKNPFDEREGARILPPTMPYPEELQQLLESATEMLGDGGMDDLGSATLSEKEGLVITLDESLLFLPGRTEVTPPGRRRLLDLAQLMVEVNNRIRVEAHGGLIAGKGGMTVWKFTSLRAAAVVDALSQDAGIADSRLTAVGLGEYAPLINGRKPQKGRGKIRLVVEFVNNPKSSR
ncbi:MAG: OmpA family protein [Deltaproteobacteria bacterium]|nr:OmpA family protein [Deltaproteobacteria bacterium]